MSYNILCVLFCAFMCVYCVLCQLEEGAPCVDEKERMQGTCAYIHRCLGVVSKLKQKSHPQICSFKGREPVICCTDCELVNDTRNVLYGSSGVHYFKTGQKAIDKCLEHMVRLDYPCALKQGLKRDFVDEKKCYAYEKPFFIAGVGGVDASEGEYPHMALLGYGEDLQTAQWLCGGSVISDRFILTAAHCISSNSLGPVKFVALGILKRTDTADKWQQYSIKRIIRHPQYQPPNKYHDIALLEVEGKIKFSRLVLPACLNTGDSNENQQYATATGWGALGHRKQLADTLQVVNLEQFTAEECATAYPPHRHLQNGYDHNTQSCYGDKNKIIDTCEGDSGGPLQVKSVHGSCIFKIIGVTSYGRACGFAGGTGMYTRVEYYVPWIESVVWP